MSHRWCFDETLEDFFTGDVVETSDGKQGIIVDLGLVWHTVELPNGGRIFRDKDKLTLI